MRRRRVLSGKNHVFPSEFDWLLYSTGTTTRRAAALLNRTRRTVHDWRTGRRPVPRWAFQLVYYTALDLPEVMVERARHRAWVDFRRCFGEPANDPVFLQAQEPRPGAAVLPAHGAPCPERVGRGGPDRGHGPVGNPGRATS